MPRKNPKKMRNRKSSSHKQIVLISSIERRSLPADPLVASSTMPLDSELGPPKTFENHAQNSTSSRARKAKRSAALRKKGGKRK